MEYPTSSLIKISKTNNFLKSFKEDSLIQSKPKAYNKKSIYPIENFVPVLRPKKAHKRPPPFNLEDDTPKSSKNKNCLEPDYDIFDKFENEDLSSDSSNFSSKEKEKIHKDFSPSEKSESPIFKYKE